MADVLLVDMSQGLRTCPHRLICLGWQQSESESESHVTVTVTVTVTMTVSMRLVKSRNHRVGCCLYTYIHTYIHTYILCKGIYICIYIIQRH